MLLQFYLFWLHLWVSLETMGVHNDTLIILEQVRCIGGMIVPFRHKECSKLHGWDEP
jgi:hypothetical protein